MKSTNVSRGTASLRPLETLSPMKPVCVPMRVSEEFSGEISGRSDNRVYSLWERLGLIFLEENAEPRSAESSVVVNNFSQQIIFQLFSQKNINRLINLNQPGFVLIAKARSSAELRSKRQILEKIEERRLRRALYSQEFERTFRLLTGEDINASGDAVARALRTVLKKTERSEELSEQSISALKALSERLQRLESFREISRELNRLLETAGQADAKQLRTLTGKLLALMIESESREKSRAAVKATMDKAAERAADIALGNGHIPSARLISQIAAEGFSEDFPISLQTELPGDGHGTIMPEEGTVLRENSGSVISEHMGDSGKPDEEGGAVGSPDTAKGTVLASSTEGLYDAAVFLLEKTEEQLSGSRSALRETELVRLINENSRAYHSELSRISGSPADAIAREAVSAVRAEREHTVYPGNGRPMTASLMSRVSGYIADKIAYEKRAGVSQLSALGGGTDYREYRMLAQAERLLSQALPGGSGKSNYELSFSGGVYSARFISNSSVVIPAERFSGGSVSKFTEISSPDIVNISSDTQNIMQTSGAVSSAENNYYRSAEISYNAENISGDTQNITQANGAVSLAENSYHSAEISYNTENRSGDTQNITQVSGTASPAENSYNNAEISYNTENRSGDTQNITQASRAASPAENSYHSAEISYNTDNRSGDTQNTTQVSGAVSPAEDSYYSAEISYNTENRSGDTQNITQVSAAVSPAESSYHSAEISNNTENRSGDTQNITQVSVAVSPAEDSYYSAEISYNTENRSGDTQNTTQVSGAVSPAESSYLSAEISYNTDNRSGEAQNITQVSGAVSPAEDGYHNTEISYNTENRFGDTQNITQVSGAVTSAENSYHSAEISYNTENRSGDTQNITQVSGAVSTAENSYHRAEIRYNAENHSENTQNTTQVSGAVSPAESSYHSTEISYTESGAEYAAAIRQGMQTGHVRPFERSERNRRVVSTDTVTGRILPADIFRGITYFVSGNALERAEPVSEKADIAAEQAVRSEISYRDNDEIFRPSQRVQTGSMDHAGRSSSYRSRLDSKTLDTLDRLINQARNSKTSGGASADAGSTAQSGRGAPVTVSVSYKYTGPDSASMEFAELPQPEAPVCGTLVTQSTIPQRVGNTELRILFSSLKNAARLKSAIEPAIPKGRHLSALLNTLEREADEQKEGITASKSGFSFRTIEYSEEMVMLSPLSQTEGSTAQAQEGYMRTLPPIEHKQREEEPKPAPAAKPKVKNYFQSPVQTVRGNTSGGFENMSREEINKLADMVYSQLYTRIMRERRRMGM